jgi:hypothetical protein
MSKSKNFVDKVFIMKLSEIVKYEKHEEFIVESV